jgi:hypothetical protein
VFFDFYRTIDRQPNVRFDNVIKQNNMKTKTKLIQSNIDQLKTMPAKDFRYMYNYSLENSPDYP